MSQVTTPVRDMMPHREGEMPCELDCCMKYVSREHIGSGWMRLEHGYCVFPVSHWIWKLSTLHCSLSCIVIHSNTHHNLQLRCCCHTHY